MAENDKTMRSEEKRPNKSFSLEVSLAEREIAKKKGVGLAGKQAELESHLTNLGFPDGGPLRAIGPRKMPGTADRAFDNDLARTIENETWNLTHADPDHFVPTLKPDERDWSPFVIKANYHAWAKRIALRYGIIDHKSLENNSDAQDLNAFRHAVTAAVFALKYGPKTALLLGTINEMITESGALAQGHLDENELADCNADLLNNRFGINIARRLLNNGINKESITLKDIVDETARELRLGMLITRPLEDWKNGNIAPELKMLTGSSDGT